MKEIIRIFKKGLLLVILYPIRIFKIKNNRIILVNNLSRKFADNPKAIALYLLEKYPNIFEIVFPVQYLNNINSYPGIKFIRYNSFSYFYYSLTAKIFVTNSGGFSFLPMCKEQVIINTFHGGGAYKKVGTDMYNDSWLFKHDLKMSANKTDVFMSTCRKQSENFTRSLLIPKEIFLEVGMPRNDCLINIDKDYRKNIKKQIGITNEEKLVLFAPTYRKLNDDYFLDSIAIDYDLNYELLTKSLSKRFGGTWKVGVRLHPTVKNKMAYADDYLDLSDYDDMQELLVATDILITDFSSCMWDFMLTGKPVFIFAKDLDHYIKSTEVYTPIDEWPFPKATSNEELYNSVINFNYDSYRLKCEKHYNDLGGCETGKATAIICDYIYDVSVKGK